MISVRESIRTKSMREVKEHWFKAIELGRQSEVLELMERENLILEQADYKQAFCLAAQNNRFDTVRWLLDYKKIPPYTLVSALNKAAENGHYNLTYWLILDQDVRPTNATLCLAAKNGHLDIVKLLLLKFNVIPQEVSTYPIRSCVLTSAASGGHLQIVKYLLTQKNIDPTFSQNVAFGIAAADGEFEIAKLLLSDKRVNPADGNNEAIAAASENGHLDLVELLLTDKRVNPAMLDNSALQGAIQNGHLKIVTLLLADERITPATLNKIESGFPLHILPERRHAEILQLLLDDPRTSSAYISTYVFLLAAQIGQIEIINRLLTDSRFNPDIRYKGDALALAAGNGHYPIVELLLKFKEIEFTTFNLLWERLSCATNNPCIKDAASNNHFDVLKLLMTDERAIATLKHGFLLCYAATNEMARFLLTFDIRPDDKDNALQEAAKKGDIERLKLLLSYDDIDPNNYTLFVTARMGNLEVLNILLATKRINLAQQVDDEFIICQAAKYGYFDMVKFLLTDDRIDPTVENYKPIRSAALNDDIQMVRLLISDPLVDEKNLDRVVENTQYGSKKKTIKNAINEARILIKCWDRLRFFSPSQLPKESVNEVQKKLYQAYMK